MRIFLVRHGETEWNRLHRYQGHQDIPLNDEGRNQANKIARFFRDNHQLEAVYSSDLARCAETAMIIAQPYHLPAILEPALRELSFGEWEGLKYEEIVRRYDGEFQKWYRDTLDYQIPGGESFQMALNRFEPVIHRIASDHSGTVAVCSHGGIIRAYLNRLDSQYGFWDRPLHPGSLSLIDTVDDGFHVIVAEFLVENHNDIMK